MCGIAGLFAVGDRAVDVATARRMSRAIAHRGPDDDGLVAFRADAKGLDALDASAADVAGAFCAFAHRRLAILDLSPAGHQPMASADGRLWITFNGEIYNFPELRRELEALGRAFRTRTDTEVLLAGYEAWGPAVVERLNGMFAFALLDARDPADPVLFLARDRFGQKPLYVAEAGGGVAFASELKALLEVPGVSREIDLAALDAYLALLWVPEPRTILRAVRKLPAGASLRITRRGREERRWWTPDVPGGPPVDEDAAARELAAILARAVTRTSIADVPVAAFLSGGLDSTAIVALMARAGAPPVAAHAVGFSAADRAHEGFPDDLAYAREVARGLALPLEETVLEASLAIDLPRLVWHLDEPLADPAILPLYAMCVAARGRTKVLLSGMGADEVFGGYRRHLAAPWLARWRRIPRPVRRSLAAALDRLPSAGAGRLRHAARRAKRFLRAAEEPNGDAWLGLASWTTPEERARLYAPRVAAQAAGGASRLLPPPPARGGLDGMLVRDAGLYLPSHNLNYTDKISMAASVEVRAPFLDHEVVDFAARLPARTKVARGIGKRVLRRAVRGIVPEAVLRRGKTGFGAPIRAWLTGPLLPTLERVLSEERLRKRGLFEPREVQGAIVALRTGREDTSHLLWALLVLELWMDAYGAEVPP